MSKVLNQFFEITKIPRPSYHEEKIRDYIYNFGKTHNLETYKDDYKNVLIRKPASDGYENYAPISLQAHMDMVCEKAPGVEIDFTKDGIEYFIDGDTVSTHGKTSLGADNGLGVSSILTILNDDSLKHPEIEAIFTSCEEENFSGAENFDGSLLKSRHLINLDHCVENEILSSSAGGITVTASKKLERIENTKLKAFKITVSGLVGGHSGEDIHKGRGNSNILLFRFLKSLDTEFFIHSIKGGSFRLSIPRESSITIFVQDEKELYEKRNEFLSIIRNEFSSVKNLNVEIENVEASYYYGNAHNENIVDYVLLLPTDSVILSNTFEGVVDASNNVGEIYIKDDKLFIISDIRANFDSQRSFIVEKITTLSKLCKFDYDVWGAYYSWPYKKDSEIRKLAFEIYKKSFDDAKVIPIHAGLECGFFSAKVEGMDIISIGPSSWDFHSPKESFSIKSLDKFYSILITILENAKFNK